MRYWRSTVEAVGLPNSVRFYDLRHAHISWLVERLGQPGALTLTEIAERAGHGSPMMTFTQFAHSPRENEDRQRSALFAMHNAAEPTNASRLRPSTGV